MPVEETWTLVKSNLNCRLDTMFKFGSRLEKMSEEFVGRNHGMLFVQTNFQIKPRDIIVLTQTQGFPEGEQYDVEFADPVLGATGLHHWEITVAKRDNLVELPS